jgi:hypothetical protein
MANNILNLAMKVTADASGVIKNLTPAERALENLGKQAEKTTSVFNQFTRNSEAAAAAQAALNDKFAALAEQLKGGLNAQAYADQYAALQQEVRNTAAAFSEASQIIEQNRTDDELRAETLARLSELLQLGALDNEQYARAVAEASGANAAAAQAEEERLRLLERGRQITEQFLTDEERRARQLEELNQVIAANGISEEAAARARFEFSGLAAQLDRDGLELRRQLAAEREADAAKEKTALEQIAAVEKRLAEDSAAAQRLRAQETARAATLIAASRTPQQAFNAAVAEATELERKGLFTKEEFTAVLRKQAAVFAKATAEADGFGKSVAKSAAGSLKLNELSGILSVLPGQFGSIAGRVSTLSSAGEGLSKLLSGGLSQGVSLFGASLAGLANPFTIAAAGFAAISTAATSAVSSLASGLVSLESRTEQVKNAADKLGVSFAFMQTLEQAAKMTGIEFGTVDSAMTKLLKTLAGADEESKMATAALDRLGVSLKELNGTNSEQQLKLIGARLQEIEDPAKRAAAATAIFGKSGADLLPFFQNLVVAEKTLTRFNARLSEIDSARVLALGDSFDSVQAALTGLSTELLTPFIGLSQSIADSLSPAISSFGRVVGNILDIISPLISTFGVLVNTVGQVAGVLLNAVSLALEPFAFAARNLSQSIDFISQEITKAFGPIADLIVSIRGVFGDTFTGIEKTASTTADSVKVVTAEAKKAADEQKKALEDLQRAIENGNKALDTAIDKAAEFGQEGFKAAFEFQTALKDLQDQADSGELNAEQYARGVANATAEYERQIEVIRKVTEETRKASEESVRVAEQTAKRLADEARRAADEAQRKAEADNKRLQTLIQQDDGTIKLQEDIAFVLEQQLALEKQIATARADADIAAAEAAVARLAELDQLQAKLEEQQQALEQGFGQGFQSAFDAVDNSINGLIAKSQEFGQAGFDAALRLQEGIAAAQEQASAGILNKEAFDAEVQRQQDLFNNEIKNIEEAEKAREKAAQDRVAMEKQQQDEAIRAQQDAYSQQQKAAEDAAGEQRRVQEEVYKQQQKIFEEQQKAAAAEAKRQEERLAKLNTLGEQTIGVQDVRTTQGANLVLDLAANAQDPALIQQRLQTKLLERIALGVGQAASNYFNQPVAIVGAARFN